MELLAALETYFRGERATGMLLVPVGLLLLALAFWCWRNEPGAFGLSLAIPLAVLGLAGAAGGAGLAIKTDAQVSALIAQHAREPGPMAQAELVRMERVNANWPRLKAAWLVVGLIALGLLMLGGREWTHGLGLALIAACALLFFVDTFAERRAEPYTRALERASGSEPVDG